MIPGTPEYYNIIDYYHIILRINTTNTTVCTVQYSSLYLQYYTWYQALLFSSPAYQSKVDEHSEG